MSTKKHEMSSHKLKSKNYTAPFIAANSIGSPTRFEPPGAVVGAERAPERKMEIKSRRN